MKILAIIPARLGSSRFPGKPLKEILGKPMIGHVYEKVSKCSKLAATIVATCDEEIASYIRSIGGTAVMTSSSHTRASDRCAEALVSFENHTSEKYDIVVMVQGDEPMTEPGMIEEAVSPLLSNDSVLVSNLMARIESIDEFNDRNCIKVVCDLNDNAMFLSREPIPTSQGKEISDAFKQVCVIPFKRDFLLKYIGLEPTQFEIIESIDMLRVLEHGYKVKMVRTEFPSHAVDTAEDLIKVEALMKSKHS